MIFPNAGPRKGRPTDYGGANANGSERRNKSETGNENASKNRTETGSERL
ncbi:hypothetical protein GS429_02775 [Natronorubrum sp. JWXQ-INN-674]|uniref:Uncharacterized protein n=1 Tax=Natronorubrum halalkaliphilum TaxID=2691917 RepID=A0A6B0VHG5_9EURY|nr:hypothetical protein [Natronorubrum halalkaliphilum]MXV60998.1 hypothetical protein [Natronorubrum halalkaliphilum]